MMKTLHKTLILLTLFLTAWTTRAQAQTTFIQDLEEVVNLAQDIRTAAVTNRTALRNLAIQYFQLNNPNPNVAAYLSVMSTQQGIIESNHDDINTYAWSAEGKNPNIDVSNITYWSSQIEAREDYIQIQSQALATAIANNNPQAAQIAAQYVRVYLNEQILFADQIAVEAADLQSVPMNYNVRIVLVDYNGDPYTNSHGLRGWYAQDQNTNDMIYPDYWDADLFSNIPAGTYIFGAYNGYWDGASPVLLTLSPEMVNGNGEVIVELTYWSE